MGLSQGDSIGEFVRRRGRRFWTFAGLLILIAAEIATAERPDDKVILDLVINSQTHEFRSDTNRYESRPPREFANGAVVETRWKLANGGEIGIAASGDLQWPEGTLLVKQFSYLMAAASDTAMCRGRIVSLSLRAYRGDDGRKLCPVELRILRKGKYGWTAHVFEWTSKGDWVAVPGGGVVSMTFSRDADNSGGTLDYAIPSLGECVACHGGRRASSEFGPIGLNLHRVTQSSAELMMREPRNRERLQHHLENANSKRESVGEARLHLDANCGYCHNPNGLAASSGLMLDLAESRAIQLGICKRPIALGFSSPNEFDIQPGHPEQSILVARMLSLEAEMAMPELGRALVDEDGVSIVSEWIRKMDGTCNPGLSGVGEHSKVSGR